MATTRPDTKVDTCRNGEEHAVRQRREDEERWAQYCRGGEAIPHDRVKAWLASLAEGLDAPCPR